MRALQASLGNDEEAGYGPLLTVANGGRLVNSLRYGAGVRRLTPTECERLQGLPDGWTDLGPDSRRYAALGDAVTANVAEWIGKRLMQHTRTAT